MSKVFELKDIPEEYLPRIGGKASGLNRLIGMGFSVPDGFIITEIENGDDFKSAVEKYRNMGLGEVSVRSSASVEDGCDFSAAGQFSTFLNISGEEALVKAIEDCISSLHNKTAESYSKMFFNVSDSHMTVVIQKMVNARCAGVIFSKAPMRPRSILVEAVPGLGENLVSGAVAAQQFYIYNGKIERSPKGRTYISRSEALALADGGKKAQNLFGQPMDLEWAIDADGKIHWLQARPITIEESVTINEFDCDIDGDNYVYTLGNIGEVIPGAVTPLNISTNMFALDWGIKATMMEMHCEDESIPPFFYISTYYNHMFFNMSNMYRICHKTYGTAKHTCDIIICGHELEGYPDIDIKDDNFFKKLAHTIPLLKLVFSGESARKGMDKTIAAIKFDLSADMDGIYRQILDNFELFKKAHYYHYCTSYYSGGATNILTLLLEKRFEDRNQLQALLAGCLTEIEDFESANVLRTMRTLSLKIVEENPQSRNYSAEELEDYILNRASDSVKQGYSDFMARHGHRGIREMEIRSLSWNQNRKSFFKSLRSVMTSLGNESKRAEKPWAEYADELLSSSSPREKKRLMKYVLKARKGVCYREYTKSKVIFALDQYKMAYRRLAELMVENEILPDIDTIYFLTQEEIGKLLKGDMSLIKKALARRRIFPQLEQMKFPFVTQGIPEPLSAINQNSGSKTYRGTPVSRGVASGRARIVNSEEDAAELREGEIMIAACTDIGWTPFYNVIGGLVTEIGSALSHGIVVAREYALPAIVNVADVMNEIHTGDMITIDGNTGTILIDSRA